MHPDCLLHRLTDQEREFFSSNGYLVVENALDQATVHQLVGVVDRVDARESSPEQRGKLMSVTNVIQEDESLVELLDCPTVLPKVWGILGWNIYLYHSDLHVTPPAAEAALRC